MSADDSGSVDAKLLVAYLDREMTPHQRSVVARAMIESAHARRTLTQLTELRDGIAQPRAELENIDLSARVFDALQAPPSPEPRRRFYLGMGAIASAAVLALAVELWHSVQEDPSEFQARAGDPAPETSRWAGVQVYRVSEPSMPSRLTDRLARSDGLCFSYTNLGTRAFEYLMIFAVDSAKNVRWFYPAYETPGTDPKAIQIEKGQSEAALAELIYQDFEPGPATIYALFAHESLAVSDVERWVAASKGELSVPLANSSLQKIRTQVVP